MTVRWYLKRSLQEVEDYLLGESEDTDSTDGVFDFLSTLSEKILEEFDELRDGNTDKKLFWRALTRIFALLLNTMVDTPEKIEKYLKLQLKRQLKYGKDKTNGEKMTGWLY